MALATTGDKKDVGYAAFGKASANEPSHLHSDRALAMIVECVVLAIVIALLVAHVVWEHSAFVSAIDSIPGPPKRPFVGNLLSFLGKQSDGKFPAPVSLGGPPTY